MGMYEIKDSKDYAVSCIEHNAPQRRKAMKWTELGVDNAEDYKDFIFPEEETTFNELYKGKEITVRVDMPVHDGDLHTATFCGSFVWDGNKIACSDGDTYNVGMHPIAYHEFTTEDGENAVCILSEDW